MSESISQAIEHYQPGSYSNENYARIWLTNGTGQFAPLSFATGICDPRRAQRQIAHGWIHCADARVLAEFRRLFPFAHARAEVWQPEPIPTLHEAVCRARDVLQRRGEKKYSSMLDALVRQHGLLDECHTAIWG